MTKSVDYTRHLEVGGHPEKLIDVINDRHARASSVLLVGHEPYLSGLISVLVSGEDDLGIALKKGGLCKLTIGTLLYGRCATLDWLLQPAHLTRME
jgi:phosphohistidine phosphatase